MNRMAKVRNLVYLRDIKATGAWSWPLIIKCLGLECIHIPFHFPSVVTIWCLELHIVRSYKAISITWYHKLSSVWCISQHFFLFSSLWKQDLAPIRHTSRMLYRTNSLIAFCWEHVLTWRISVMTYWRRSLASFVNWLRGFKSSY